MDINKKIEEIRQQPEHVRIRYVWIAVAVSMFFIILIWLFSLNESFKKTNPASDMKNLPSIKQSIEEMQSIKNEMPSADEIGNDLQELEDQNSAKNQAEGQINTNEQKNNTLPSNNSVGLPTEEQSKTQEPATPTNR